MSASHFITLAVLGVSIMLVALFWWSGSWSLERRRQFHSLWPMLFLAAVLEVMSIFHFLVLPQHWPLASLGVVLVVAWLSRYLKPRARLWIRALSFGLSFGATPLIYSVISPAVLVMYVWPQQWNTFEKQLSIYKYIVVVVAFYTGIAALYLHFVNRKTANKPQELPTRRLE